MVLEDRFQEVRLEREQTYLITAHIHSVQAEAARAVADLTVLLQEVILVYMEGALVEVLMVQSSLFQERKV